MKDIEKLTLEVIKIIIKNDLKINGRNKRKKYRNKIKDILIDKIIKDEKIMTPYELIEKGKTTQDFLLNLDKFIKSKKGYIYNPISNFKPDYLIACRLSKEEFIQLIKRLRMEKRYRRIDYMIQYVEIENYTTFIYITKKMIPFLESQIANYIIYPEVIRLDVYEEDIAGKTVKNILNIIEEGYYSMMLSEISGIGYDRIIKVIVEKSVKKEGIKNIVDKIVYEEII